MILMSVRSMRTELDLHLSTLPDSRTAFTPGLTPGVLSGSFDRKINFSGVLHWQSLHMGMIQVNAAGESETSDTDVSDTGSFEKTFAIQ